MKQYFKKLTIIPVMLSFFCVSSPVSLVSKNCDCIHKIEHTKVIDLSEARKVEKNGIGEKIFCHVCGHLIYHCICKGLDWLSRKKS